MRKYLFAAILSALISFSGNAQSLWKQFQGPYTGDINTFASKGDTLFAGANFAGLYKSVDSGKTWQATPLREGHFYNIFVYGSKLIACTGNTVFVSEDNGLSWTSIPETSVDLRELFLFRDTIYVGSSTGVYTMDPLTYSLTPKSNGIGQEIIVSFTAMDTVLFCGTFNKGLYYSTNYGDTWQKITAAAGFNAISVASLLNYKGLVIASGYGNRDIYVSADTGKTWNQRAEGLASNSWYADLVEYNDTAVLATRDGVFAYHAAAQSWDTLSTDVFNNLYVKGSLLLASNSFGVYRYNRSSGLFEISNHGINTSKVLDLALFGDRLYAATECGVFFTSDSGDTWMNVPETKGLWSHAIAVTDTFIFLGTDKGMLTGSISNTSWNVSLGSLTSGGVWDIYAKDSTLLASTDSGVFISGNRGQSWNVVRSGLANPFGQVQTLAVTSSLGKVFASGSFGLFQLSADSSQWDLIGFQNDGGGMLKIIDSIIYFGKELSGLYKSIDTGKTWIPINSGSSSLLVFDMIKRGDNNLYASGIRNIYYSPDEGASWNDFYETGMPDLFIYKLIESDSSLYAGTYGNGVWHRNYLNLTGITSAKYSISNGNIGKVPSNTTVTDLVKNLNPAHGASIASVSSSGPIVKAGDMVTVMAEDSTTFRSYTINLTTSVHAEKREEILLYPTPATDKIYFLNTDNIEQVMVYSTLGNMLINAKPEQNSVSISTLPPGIYEVVLTADKGKKYRFRFAKQ